ncbi:hypothetical protein B0T16DRAFT_452654 [Cercophora newfieldiana]|uniref:Abscission/NoCut checkpoint regulator n=1 Tax=Cercophora newfieldiana TaxID=92897 RepID=A0AA40D1V6_9PEZI|nr:hypothetical protein B0T16DRAFT_452654 [Cercophora newfieldiana]
MAPLRPSDQSLLARLNALKPTSVSLDKAANITPADASVIAATGPTSQQPGPASREDALAARLRILRNAAGNRSASGTDRESANVDLQNTQPQSESFKTTSLSVESVSSSYPTVTQDPAVPDEQSDDPYLFETDDLNDLLDGLDNFDLDHGLNAGGYSHTGFSEVSDILESLKDPNPNKLKSQDENDDDDSEGEQMSRDIGRILAQIQDEISTGKEQGGRPPNEASAATSHSITTTNSVALPGVPSSQLVGPAIDEADDGTCGTARKSLEFENEITTRLASLRGLGSGVNFDSFGLPTAPTFEPENRSASTAASLVTKRGGYTDEDQKTWCIVCLDDATIRCVGCDNDVYCSRCWKELHFGSSAGYDYRGHNWVKFQK